RGTAAAGGPDVGGINRLTFTNTGASSQNLTAEVAPGSVATEVVIDPTNPLVLYAGLVRATDTTKDGVYQSLDGGDNWQLLTNHLLNGSEVGDWMELSIGPSIPQTIYLAMFK